jgi:hypothetical protein
MNIRNLSFEKKIKKIRKKSLKICPEKNVAFLQFDRDKKPKCGEGTLEEALARCQFNQLFTSAFLYQSVLRRFSLVTVWFCNFLAQEYWCKSC